MKNIFAVVALASSCFLGPAAGLAAPIQGPSLITASTDIQPCHVSICLGLGTDVSEIADGVSSNSNGFAGQDGVVGIINLDLNGVFNLNSFTLYNDIVVRAEGVGTFMLHFFNASDSLISSSAIFTAPIGQFGPETYTFGAPILGVSSVDFEVLSLLNGTRIEVRELLFDGEAVTTVPLPAAIMLMSFGMFLLSFIRVQHVIRDA